MVQYVLSIPSAMMKQMLSSALQTFIDGMHDGIDLILSKARERCFDPDRLDIEIVVPWPVPEGVHFWHRGTKCVVVGEPPFINFNTLVHDSEIKFDVVIRCYLRAKDHDG